ncbi:MAG: adenosylmethionine--8-amino-7-oxononanoate transaminase [Gammaproteobacteria bacterium 28-57-27]|nr:MAG: adenosylmethionine--8-amino-7-oxononanoate transaminase [Gammaproteobacteria bacterium 28-57-27]
MAAAVTDSPNNFDWNRRDLDVLWHPCTQMKDHERLPVIPIARGQGIWLYDFDGRRYLDAVSSWWVNLFGHANPFIGARIKQQLDTLEHVLLAGFTHQPVIELSERLVKLTPPGLSRVFYADNGSSGIEVALKMSYHAWRNLGATRKTKFVALEHSYHGETLGALSVGDVSLFKDTYQPLLMEVMKAPSPDCSARLPGESCADVARRAAAGMEALLAAHHDEISAVIIEPLVQCASGMRMYDPLYLTLLRELCDRYQVHLIADEIAVGFGRTGTLFACEQAAITPDIMILSKGLTGGFLPLAAVLTTDAMYRVFYDDYDKLSAFLHSHSYTGNPLACAAALATLDLFEQNDVIGANRVLSKTMLDAVADLSEHPHVFEVRQTGMILAIEMVKNKTAREAFPWQERRGLRVFEHGLKHEALLRPLGNVVYWMPPYVISADEISQLAAVTRAGIDVATR